jgi:ATP-dependent helicase/nuclease subunit B
MYSYLKTIEEITQQYPFEKKVIIVPSYVDGNALRKTLTSHGISSLNFHHNTLFDIARKFTLEDLLKNKLNILDNPMGIVIIMQIIKDLSSQNNLSYFQLPIISIGLSKTVFCSIKEIRAAGYDSKSWLSVFTTESDRLKDLHRIMIEYEKQINDRRLVDEANLYSRAIASKHVEEDTIFLVPSNIQMNSLEKLFYNQIIKPTAKIIEFPCPEAILSPASFPLALIKDTNKYYEHRILNLLSYNEKTDKDLPIPEIEFLRSHGEYIEVREVLRIILKKKIPFGKVQILYTQQEPYSQYFYQLLNSSNEFAGFSPKQIPATFHSGIHIKNSRPAAFFFDLIEWLNDNYSIKRLFVILNSGNINLHLPEPFTEEQVALLLRKSPIGWERKRYIPGIKLAIRELEKKLENSSDDRIKNYQNEINLYRIIGEWIAEIFNLFPNGGFDFRVSLAVLAGGIRQIVNKYSVIENNSLDEKGLQIINKKLDILEKQAKEEMTYSEALSIIKDMLSNEYICSSEASAGKLHIASYKKGNWQDKPYTFIVGMDSHKFPGITSEGTMFSEAEKTPYQHLLTDMQKNKIEQIRLLHLLLNLKGKKYLSFSCFDTLNNQEQAPASLLLQLYRLSRQNWEISYEEFSNSLGEMKKFIPTDKTEFLDEEDVFLYFSNKEKKDMQPFLQKKYGDYVEGIKADAQRRAGEFNSYNGKVNISAEKFDPRQNRGIVISSSKLERIAICPYLYFLNDILKVKKPEEMEYEPVQWMNPLERGLLLHQIYEIFYRRLMEKSQGAFEPPSFNKHWQMLEKIAEECLEEKRKYLAPPGELIYQAERREIIDSCKIFLNAEEEYYKGQVPQYFELAFGTRDNEHEVLGKVRSVELNLPAGEKISFQGKIDRIDLMPDGTYRIIDYKTGGSGNYKKGKPYRHGEQLQHALYAVALQKILKKKYPDKKVIISESGYYFPTEYGRGDLVLYKQKNATEALNIVEILLDMISEGVFPMTKKPEHFMCRDYQDIMEQNELISVNGKSGKKYEEESAFDNLRRLKQFE